MAVTKRNGRYYIYFRPFKDKKVGVKLDVQHKSQARQIEAILIRACRSGNYGGLDPMAREACLRMFRNQGWQLPPELSGEQRPRQEFSLWQACEVFLTYPGISESRIRWRYEYCLANLVPGLGKERAVKTIWIPDLRAYQVARQKGGASPATVNWELATLSKMFGVLMELQVVECNPVRMIKRLSTKGNVRQAYLSFQDVQRIADRCPAWFRPIIFASYYGGLRRGEILALSRRRLNLHKRMIYLGPEETKEGYWKRVPIHRDLVPLFEEALKISALGTDQVFLVKDRNGVRPLREETAKNPWPRACEALELERPCPRFHDLRHTWRTNARRSGMDPQIAESIMGHWYKERAVTERYGRISDQELVQAIDSLTFDHGPTEILVLGR